MSGPLEPTEQPEGFLPHLIELTRQTLPPMHPAGRPFVLGGVVGTLLLRRLWRPLGLLGLIVTGWCAWFFREPRRVAPTRPGVVVASADGTVSQVVPAAPPAELGIGDEPMLRISVFLSIFDVHVQRLPATGEIRRIAYRPGKFLSADLDKASEDNERNAFVIAMTNGRRIAAVQIAGLVARRIVPFAREREAVAAGQRIGMIRFGSRVDVYLPEGTRPLAAEGQTAIAGETVIADLALSDPGRTFRVA